MVAKSKKEKSRARAQLGEKTLRLRLKGGKEVAAKWGWEGVLWAVAATLEQAKAWGNQELGEFQELPLRLKQSM